MLQTTIRLLVALLTFAVGVAASLLWSVFQPAPALSQLAAPCITPSTIAGVYNGPVARSSGDLSSTRPTIWGGVLNGKAISKPAPAYPAIARAAQVQGGVTVQVVLDEQGDVVSAYAVAGHPLLRQAAVEAARQAKFSPTLLSGRPVRVGGTITYNFILQ